MAMTHTFDIRFEQASGLGALLEAPGNSFRWKGNGQLRVDAGGIHVSAGRSLWSLMRERARRIPAADIKEVYREGEALRLEFATPDTRRVVLPFWAKDRQTAARIVSLLPTTRTVEMEARQGATSRRKPPRRWGAATLVLGVLAVAAVAAYKFASQPEPVGADRVAAPVSVAEPLVELDFPAIIADTARNEPAKPADAGEVGLLFPSRIVSASVDDSTTDLSVSVVVTPRYRESIKPIDLKSEAYAFARQQLAELEREGDAITSAFLADQRQWTNLGFTRELFVTRLEALESRWWQVTFRILNTSEFQKYPELADFRRTLLMTGRLSRLHLTLFAQGVRYQDPGLLILARDAMTRADEMRAVAQRFLR
jgi:hypothetical protein